MTVLAARNYLGLALIVAVWTLGGASASAQDSPPTAAKPSETSEQASSSDAPARPMPETMGGMPEDPRSEQYTSPLQTLGVGMGAGSYVLSAFASLIYLVVVYPLQALFGNSKVEPVMLWMLVPVAGPWFAQYTHSVKDKPVWRGVLIGDSALQATGLVLGLIGYALSGMREPEPERSGLRLDLGAVGSGAMGLNLTLRTL